MSTLVCTFWFVFQSPGLRIHSWHFTSHTEWSGAGQRIPFLHVQSAVHAPRFTPRINHLRLADCWLCALTQLLPSPPTLFSPAQAGIWDRTVLSAEGKGGLKAFTNIMRGCLCFWENSLLPPVSGKSCRGSKDCWWPLVTPLSYSVLPAPVLCKTQNTTHFDYKEALSLINIYIK